MSADAAVDTYIAQFPDDVQLLLHHCRALVREVAPAAVESMAYGLPAYKLNGKPLVYYGAFAKHIGFYATPTGHEAFAKELASYKQGRGSVQFPFSRDMPRDLIQRIVRFRVDELSGRW